LYKKHLIIFPENSVAIRPWKLQGLPGLILSAKFIDGKFQFVANKITFEYKNIFFTKEGLKQVSHKNILKYFEQSLYGSDIIEDVRDVKTTVSKRNGIELKYE